MPHELRFYAAYNFPELYCPNGFCNCSMNVHKITPLIKYYEFEFLDSAEKGLDVELPKNFSLFVYNLYKMMQKCKCCRHIKKIKVVILDEYDDFDEWMDVITTFMFRFPEYGNLSDIGLNQIPHENIYHVEKSDKPYEYYLDTYEEAIRKTVILRRK